MYKTIIEPFRIKSIEPVKMTTEQQRVQFIRNAHYNPFLLQSDQVLIDLLTDSGTSAMSTRQWAGIMEGDESYAGARSWQKLEKAIHSLTGMPYILPTHQGRAAERILYGHLGGKGKIFISNTHFDTTRANIEFTGAKAIDIVCEEANDLDSDFPFKGNMNVEALKQMISQYKESIAAVILTVTNNSGGGQPVSLDNIRQVSAECRANNILLILDCCRIAENSYFVKHRTEGITQTYREIAQKFFNLSDGCIMSAKKDALVNMGGFLALRDSTLARACTQLLIITEGFTTYGGLAGRDMEAIAIGLEEVFDEDYLHYRIISTQYLGDRLKKNGVPLMSPVGGHAIYIDARRLYPHIPVQNYPGQVLVCELFKKGGIRAVEIGSLMFGRYDENRKLIPAKDELVRLAIPRRVYTQSHIDYVVEVFEDIVKDRMNTVPLEIIYESEFLRHFTAHLRPAVDVAEEIK